MQLRQLRYILTLARERHFGRAAQACDVSQPALSQALRQIETTFGVPLIQRGSRGFVGLTPEGEQIVEWARRVLADYDSLVQNFAAVETGGLSGHLRIGAIPMAMPMIATMTTAFNERFPAVAISVLSLNFTDLERALERFEIEVGITYLDVPRNPGLRPYVLYDEEYFLLAPADHPVASRTTVTWREAGALPLCLLTRDMYNRQFIDRIFLSLAVEVRPVIETNCALSIYSHARSGKMFAIVPQTYLALVAEGLAGMRAIPLAEPRATNCMGFFIANRAPISPVTKAFVDVTQEPISSKAFAG